MGSFRFQNIPPETMLFLFTVFFVSDIDLPLPQPPSPPPLPPSLLPLHLFFQPPPLPSPLPLPPFLLLFSLFLLLCFESEMPPPGLYFECSVPSLGSFNDDCMAFKGWGSGWPKLGSGEETLMVKQSPDPPGSVSFLPAAV